MNGNGFRLNEIDGMGELLVPNCMAMIIEGIPKLPLFHIQIPISSTNP
jgi:hypothetical protein